MRTSPHRGHFHLHPHECSFGSAPEVRHGGTERIDRSADRTRLIAALVVTAAVMCAEFVGGWWAGSLALIGDAGHMLADGLAIAVSLLAFLFASRPPTRSNSFGFYRLEILAALFNGFVLSLLTLWILSEAVRRLMAPRPVDAGVMLWIGLLGLAANIVVAAVLRRGRPPGESGAEISLNLRGAYLHVLGDAISSAGVVVAALAIRRTGWTPIDPLLSLALCVVILFSAYRLIRDSVNILLEAAPARIPREALIDTLKVIDDVLDVHDVHIWTLTSGLHAFSAHVAIPDIPVSQTSRLLKRINFILCQQYGIGHTAIQFETRQGLPGESRRD